LNLRGLGQATNDLQIRRDGAKFLQRFFDAGGMQFPSENLSVVRTEHGFFREADVTDFAGPSFLKKDFSSRNVADFVQTQDVEALAARFDSFANRLTAHRSAGLSPLLGKGVDDNL